MKITPQNQLPDKFFYFPIIGLALCLVLKIIQTAIRISKYPFNSILDLENRGLYLFFLKAYGFHQLVADTYHHIILFKDYPPGWYYFTFPFYIFTGDLLIAIFLSLLATLVLGFLFVYFFNKNLSLFQRIAYFLILFANLQMIDYIHIGRYPEILAWVVFFPLLHYMFHYRAKKIDIKCALAIMLLFSVLILVHIYAAIVSFTIIFSLFVIKNNKEKLIIFLTTLASLILTSFWWVPFLSFVKTPHIKMLEGGISLGELLNSGSVISYNTIFILGFYLITFLYIKQVRNKIKNFLFLLPSLILGFLILTRLIVFIPVLNRVPITPYNIYFLFLLSYIFFHINFQVIKIKKFLFWVLILLTLGSLSLFFCRITPFIPPKDSLRVEVYSFFPLIQDNFFIFNPEGIRYNARYAKITYNLSSPNRLHWAINEEAELNEAFRNKNCDRLNSLVKELKLKNLIAYDQGCDILKKCNFYERLYKERACLYYSIEE